MLKWTKVINIYQQVENPYLISIPLSLEKRFRARFASAEWR